jgi:ABC-type oligopeptide transport system substrate-binding subunit
MPIQSRLIACGALLGLSALLSACGTAPASGTAAATAPTGTAATSAADDRAGESITGSRIPSKTTDRLVRTTGAAGAKEMERNRPPDPGPKIN